jgi:hypothetical protein
LAIGTSIEAGGGFDFSVNKSLRPEIGLVTTCFLSTERSSYTFMPPNRWTLETDSVAKRINMTSPEKSVISIRSLDEGGEPTAARSSDALRGLVAERLPEGKIVEEFACFTDGASGKAFDVEFASSVGTKMKSRLVFVWVGGQTIEFLLTANADRFQGDSMTLSSLLTTFQVPKAEDRSPAVSTSDLAPVQSTQ